MRPVFDNGSPVPAFLNKLWKMVDDQNTDDLISWSPSGQSFIIKNQSEFCSKLLPQFYKHNNMASFVRQLNMYGFHKVSNIDSGILSDRDEIEFTHLYFIKDEPKLVEKIKRKMPSRVTNNMNSSTDGKQMEMAKVLKDIAEIYARQLSLDAELATVKQHNVALWREILLLRRKHQKQQLIVNKLIQFLLSLVQPSANNLSGLGLKRKYPLMINDSKQSRKPGKVFKRSASNKNKASENSSRVKIREIDGTDALLEEAEMLEDYIEPLVDTRSPESQQSDIENRKNNQNYVSSESPDSLLLEFDDSSVQSEDFILSPELLFATSPNLIKEPSENSRVVAKSSQPTAKEKQILAGQKIKKKIKVKKPTRGIKSEKFRKVDAGVLEATDGSEFIALHADKTGHLRPVSPNDLTQGTLLNNIKIEPNESEQQQEDTIQNFAQVIEDIPIDIDYFLPESSSPINSSNPLSITYKPDTSVGDAATIGKVDSSASGNSNEVSEDVSQQNNESQLSLVTRNNDNASQQTPMLNSAKDLDSQLELVQTKLDSLKGLLGGERYSIDANTLLGLLAADDPLSYTLPIPDNTEITSDVYNYDTTNINNSDPVLSGSEFSTPSFDFDVFFTEDGAGTTTQEKTGTDLNDWNYLDSTLDASVTTPTFPNIVEDK